MKGVFVTAIGTDCGKTHVAAAIIREMTARDHRILALKPLMSGFDPNVLASSDAGRLLAAMGRAVTPSTIDEIVWQRFSEWSAPNVAARNAGVNLEYDDLRRFVTMKAQAFEGPVLVEGAGGVMSPLTDDKTNIDLIADLGLPVLLMASNYLGAVSHTLTALEVLSHRMLEVSAIAVTQPLPDAGVARPFVEELARWTAQPILECGFSRGHQDDQVWARPLVDLLFG